MKTGQRVFREFLLPSGKRFKTGEKTILMGVLNVTPDSFSDGGSFHRRERAISRALALEEDGADIIDIGGESTRPGADPLPLEEELERVLPVIEALAPRLSIPISIDTYKAETARAALEAGADLVNDISGLRRDPAMAGVVARYRVPVILMHSKGTPKNMQVDPTYGDLLGEIAAFFREGIALAREAGIREEHIILDPGIGFGKTVEHNLQLLYHIDYFKDLGCPLLLGTSRKSVVGKLLDLPVDQRVEGTIATIVWGIGRGVEIFRVHDVKEVRRAAVVADAIVAQGFPRG